MKPLDLATIFRDAGARGWLHAVRVGDPSETVQVDADEPVAMASVYKLPLAICWAQLVHRGELDPVARVRLTPQRRTPGPTGISLFTDEVEMSQRDLVRQMLIVSDNAAADTLLDLVGLDTVNATLRRLGLERTVVLRGTRASQLRIQRDTGTRAFSTSMRALAALDRDTATSEYDSALASHTTAREMTTLLDLLWRRRVDAGAAGDLIAEAMTRQIWRTRLASGFPHDDVTVAGKTGTLGTLRHEIAVVTFPGETPIAVAVFTRSARPERQLPAVDTAIGAAAQQAVHRLRRPQDAPPP